MNRGSVVGGYRAEEYTTVVAAAGGEYSNRSLYHVVGMPGIWRRVSRPKVSDPSEQGILQCFFDGAIVYLVPDTEIGCELGEGNWCHLLSGSDGPSPGEMAMDLKDHETFIKLCNAARRIRQEDSRTLLTGVEDAKSPVPVAVPEPMAEPEGSDEPQM